MTARTDAAVASIAAIMGVVFVETLKELNQSPEFTGELTLFPFAEWVVPAASALTAIVLWTFSPAPNVEGHGVSDDRWAGYWGFSNDDD